MLPDGFEFIDGQLCCENQSVKQMAEKFGTPLYIYSENHFLARLQEFQNALEDFEQ
jgi:diaminopimelate decarboxylase